MIKENAWKMKDGVAEEGGTVEAQIKAKSQLPPTKGTISRRLKAHQSHRYIAPRIHRKQSTFVQPRDGQAKESRRSRKITNHRTFNTTSS